MARFIKAFWDDLQGQHDRWILWAPAPLALGIAFYFSLRAEPPPFAGVICLVLAAPLLRAFHKNGLVFTGVLSVFLVIAGFAAAQWRVARVAAPVLAHKTYAVTVEGRVAAVDKLPKAYRVVLENIAIAKGHVWQDDLPARVRIRLKNNDPAIPEAGSDVRIRAVLLPLSPPVMPGAFDFQRHAFFERLGATGYALGGLETLSAAPRHDFLFDRMRRAIREKIEAAVSSRDNAAILTAFMIGDDGGISEEDWETARLSGIAHLIAISGSHFVLIAGFPFFLVRALLAAIPYVALRWPVKKIAALFAIAVSVFYMLLIGSPIPAQRAVIMTCVVMAAVMLDRDPFTLRLAAFAAAVLLLAEPESLTGPSFQMSFAAVVGLIAFYEQTRGWWRRHLQDADWSKRYALYLFGCVMTTVVASAATAPYALYHFSRMPLLSGLAANMIAVPVSSFVTFPVGLLACLLMPLGLEKWPLWLTEKSLDLVMYVARAVAAWPHAAYQVNAWPAFALALVTLGGLWLVIWRGRVRFAGMAFAAAGVLAAMLSPQPDILAAASGDLFAVRGPDGHLWMSPGRKEGFVRAQWLQREDAAHDLADKTLREWPLQGGAPGGFLSCDADACLYRAKGQAISFIRRASAAAEDCAQSALLIGGVAMKQLPPSCAGIGKIDKWDLRDKGAHAVYLHEGGGYDIVSVAQVRGVRPWSPAPKPFRRFKKDAEDKAAETDAKTESEALKESVAPVAADAEDSATP